MQATQFRNGSTGLEQELPPESEMDREDALNAFLAIVNTCEPDHPYFDKSEGYPIMDSDVDYYTTRTYHGRCGPRRGLNKVGYGTRLTYINSIDRAEHLAYLTHEVSHIPDPLYRHIDVSSHPPAFWREMAFHALLVRDALEDGTLRKVFPHISVDDYLDACVIQPNSSTVDRRYHSVEEVREMMADLLNREY